MTLPTENKSALDQLQENLARDLVKLEQNETVDPTAVEQVNKVYSDVYDIISKLKLL